MLIYTAVGTDIRPKMSSTRSESMVKLFEMVDKKEIAPVQYSQNNIVHDYIMI